MKRCIPFSECVGKTVSKALLTDAGCGGRAYLSFADDTFCILGIYQATHPDDFTGVQDEPVDLEAYPPYGIVEAGICTQAEADEWSSTVRQFHRLRQEAVDIERYRKLKERFEGEGRA